MGQATEEERNRLASQTQPTAAAETTEDPEVRGLLGSNTQPALFIRENGEEVQLGEVVREAFAQSGLTGEVWNKSSDDAREEAIAAVVEEWGLEPWQAPEPTIGEGNYEDAADLADSVGAEQSETEADAAAEEETAQDAEKPKKSWFGR